ncbi:MAG: peptide chain release factor N(5)-glutamine methyltransferase [Holosporaceae bacterium]|jgi:release factor glutamine methyltransferase|nr:peptide chain release factor N(5)-glutamine methyltransferase [Holosporaceae bacterium]
MKNTVDIETLLKEYANKSSIRDVRRLIAHAKKISYEDVFFHGSEQFLSPEEHACFLDMLGRYGKNEPISKIINRKSFWKHDFFVNENVLDPRPETELIIEAVLRHFDPESQLSFLDLGTGSGCILLSLLYEFKKSTGIGIDISPKALEVAVRNRQVLGISGAAFLEASWNHPLDLTPASCDVIVSNPPYIKTQDLAQLDENIRKYDPPEALDGGASGLDAYLQIAQVSKKFLKKNGRIFLEVGYDQADDVARILAASGYEGIRREKDLQALDRVVCAFGGW